MPTVAASKLTRFVAAIMQGAGCVAEEAETIARGDLSPEEASANVAYLRQMIEQERDRKGRKGAPSAFKQAAES